MEMERLKRNTKLREAKLDQEKERQHLEHSKLEFVKEGKLLDVASGTEEHGGDSSSKFNVSGCLRLVPKISETVPETFLHFFLAFWEVWPEINSGENLSRVVTVMRWCWFLQPLTLNIRDLKGAANVVADAMSRA